MPKITLRGWYFPRDEICGFETNCNYIMLMVNVSVQPNEKSALTNEAILQKSNAFTLYYTSTKLFFDIHLIFPCTCVLRKNLAWGA